MAFKVAFQKRLFFIFEMFETSKLAQNCSVILLLLLSSLLLLLLERWSRCSHREGGRSHNVKNKITQMLQKCLCESNIVSLYHIISYYVPRRLPVSRYVRYCDTTLHIIVDTCNPWENSLTLSGEASLYSCPPVCLLWTTLTLATDLLVWINSIQSNRSAVQGFFHLRITYLQCIIR